MYRDPEVRRTMHCGWIDESQWVGTKPDLHCDFGDEPYDQSVCPGWALVQPLIVEIAVAHKSFEKGNWGAIQGDAPSVVVEGVEYFDTVLARYLAWSQRKADEQAKTK